MVQSPPRSGVSMAVRSLLWILVSIVFLVQDSLRIQRLHEAGRPVTNWILAQLFLWSAVFIFWTFAAWRDWKRRNDARRVV